MSNRTPRRWVFPLAGCLGLLGLVGVSDVLHYLDAAEVQASFTNRNIKATVALIDQRINQQLQKAKIPASPRADDAEFLRRAFLDLTGRIPSPAQVVAFLDSANPDKRAKLIDELLASKEFGAHVARQWTKRMLAVGVPGPKDTGTGFQGWLTDQLNSGTGWDRIVKSILTVQSGGSNSQATFFYEVNSDDGKLSPAMLTGATTQLFLGVQIQCAECHDHPSAKWTQQDFWGMASFFGRLNGGGKKGGGGISEKTVTTSANAAPAKGNNKKGGGGPAPSFKTDKAGLPTIVIPSGGGNKGGGKVVSSKFLYGQPIPENLKNLTDAPLRPFLAEWVASPKNEFFAKNTANWAWAHLFGRGFVNPIDDFQEGLEPSHPAVLDQLVREFAASNYELRHLFRCICNSEAYQRTSRALPANKDDEELFSHVAGKTIGAEVFHDMLIDALAVKSLVAGPAFFNPLNKDGSKGKAAKQLPQTPARDQFVKIFTTEKSPDRTTQYTHGIPQMLRLLNSTELKEPAPRVELALKAGTTPEQVIEHLYLATLARRPQAEESRLMADYARRRPSPAEGYNGVLWILLNCSEFQLNH